MNGDSSHLSARGMQQAPDFIQLPPDSPSADSGRHGTISRDHYVSFQNFRERRTRWLTEALRRVLDTTEMTAATETEIAIVTVRERERGRDMAAAARVRPLALAATMR